MISPGKGFQTRMLACESTRISSPLAAAEDCTFVFICQRRAARRRRIIDEALAGAGTGAAGRAAASES